MLPIFNDILRLFHNDEQNEALRLKRKNLRRNFTIDILSEARFIELFRVSKQLFQDLYDILSPHLMESRYICGVSVKQKLLVALRFYATGSYQRSIGEDFNLGMSQTCVHR